MASTDSAGIDLRHYIRVVRRHLILIVVATLVCGAAAYFYSASKIPMYAAKAVLLYEPQLDISNPTSSQGRSDAFTQALELDSASAVISSPTITERVKNRLGNSEAWPSYSLTAAPGATTDASGSSPRLDVEVDSSVPDWSAKAANAYADAFIAWRVENDKSRIAAAIAVISQKLNEFTTTEQKLSSEYILLQTKLQELEISSATATGNFRLVAAASTPSAPFSPQPKRSGAIGAVLGFGVGLGLALLRDKMDTSLRSHREVRDIMDLPIVGRIPRIPEEALSKGAIVVTSEGEGRAAESMRVLRSNLEFVCLGEEHRRLMVVSPQKGEGKSLIVANLAASLALAGKNVVLVDADLRRPKINRLFNLMNNVGVSNVIAGRIKLEEALQTYNLLPTVHRQGGNGKMAQVPTGSYDVTPSLRVLTSGPIPPNPGEMVASQRFADILDQLAAMPFDYILVDSPAFLSVGDVAALAAHVDGLFLVINMKMTGRPMLEDAREFLAPLPARKLGVITVNDQTGNDERYHYYAGKD